MNADGIPEVVSLGYDVASGAVACSDYVSSPVNKWIPYGQSWNVATFLWNDAAGTVKAISGYYSNGPKWRYWDDISETFTSTAFC